VVTELTEGYESFTEDNIVEYCTMPRTLEEIKEYFGIGQDLLYKVIRPLIAEGKLIYTKPTKVGGKIIHKKLVKNDFPQTPQIERTKSTENDIMRYCQEPRFVYEIISEFGINDYTARQMTNKLIAEGRLIHTGFVGNRRHRKLRANG